MRTPHHPALVAAALLTLVMSTGCGSVTPAYGDATSIIAAMSPEIWNKVSGDVQSALEPTIYTVRNEKTFTVTYQDPGDSAWANLSKFRQMLVVGTGEEPWMQPAVQKSLTPIQGPGLYTAADVWASGQQVTIVILSSPDSLDQLRRYLPEINKKLDDQYRQWARNRMYLSGIDTAYADTLMAQAHFSITLPDVYRHAHKDSVWIFRNDQPDPSELIRQIGVTWRSPIPKGYGTKDFLAWRAQLVGYYNEGQVLDTASELKAGPMTFQGHDAYEIQGIWDEPPDMNWPAAGPFIDRAITCPEQNRLYYIDAWLYAPGKKKYQYMIQLQTILDTFRCGTGA